MAIGKKHYEQVAELLQQSFETFRSYAQEKRNVPCEEVKRQFAVLTYRLAKLYKQDNKNFDKKMFYTACCQLTEYERLMKDLDNVEF